MGKEMNIVTMTMMMTMIMMKNSYCNHRAMRGRLIKAG
jgi:hypothetical protein